MYLGAGVAAGYFNSDGLEDIFFLGNIFPNKLYINQGDLKFNDISDSSEVKGDVKGGFNAVSPREFGLFMLGDVRYMRTIQVGGETHLLVAKNDGALQQIRIN
tara:strand:+ start:447 stop:755 length:309 start_codon:yes stop_codon:yes gene_type:complete